MLGLFQSLNVFVFNRILFPAGSAAEFLIDGVDKFRVGEIYQQIAREVKDKYI